MKKIWIGRWLMAMAALHLIYGAVKYSGALRDMMERGVVNSVAGDPLRAAATWFMLFGPGLLLLGLAVTALEKAGVVGTLRALGWGLLAIAVLGVLLMPASGFWLAFPPALALALRKESTDLRPDTAASSRAAAPTSAPES